MTTFAYLYTTLQIVGIAAVCCLIAVAVMTNRP